MSGDWRESRLKDYVRLVVVLIPIKAIHQELVVQKVNLNYVYEA